MPIPLRQSTAASIVFGPLVDKTDGVSGETAVATPIFDFWKNGAASTGQGTGNIRGWAHVRHGYYGPAVTATLTSTAGFLRMAASSPAVYVPVWQDYQVIPQPLYDAMYSATASAYASAASLASVAASVTRTSVWTAARAAFVDSTISSRARSASLAAVAASMTNNRVWTDAKAGYLDVAVSGRASQVTASSVLSRLPNASPGAPNGLPVMSAAGSFIVANNLPQVVPGDPLGLPVRDPVGELYVSLQWSKVYNGPPANTATAASLAAVQDDATLLLADTAFQQQLALNKMTNSTATGNMVLYDDDSLATLKTWAVTDVAGVQTRNKAT